MAVQIQRKHQCGLSVLKIGPAKYTCRRFNRLHIGFSENEKKMDPTKALGSY